MHPLLNEHRSVLRTGAFREGFGEIGGSKRDADSNDTKSNAAAGTSSICDSIIYRKQLWPNLRPLTAPLRPVVQHATSPVVRRMSKRTNGIRAPVRYWTVTCAGGATPLPLTVACTN